MTLTEALTNVLKHAGAERASVTLRQHNGTLDVTVSDDERGFVPGSAAGKPVRRVPQNAGGRAS
ncbi:MAG: hypothetical protein ACRD0U_15295 [Acidimicrobiales bacterium]